MLPFLSNYWGGGGEPPFTTPMMPILKSPIEKGGQTENGKVPFPERVPIDLNITYGKPFLHPTSVYNYTASLKEIISQTD